MKRSQKAAPKNLSQTIAKPFARKKYDFTQEGDPKAGPELSAGDTKALARLIRKYENKTVVAAAKVLPPGRGPGRPSRGLLPYYERMHLTEWIEERAEEHRQNGSTKPYIEAEIDLYEMFFGEETPRDLQKFRRTIKKSRQQGRRDLIEHLQNTLKHPSYKGQQDLIQTLQHYQKHSRSYKTEK